ncbi:MAG: hypothetical protein K6F08_00100 [bacterium]|nr:hypothetical protein [bacterium]
MRKNPRIKILLALFSIAVAVVAAVFCTVSVLAMPSDSVIALFASNSNESISAEVWASYQIEGQESVDFVSKNNQKKIVLNENISLAGFEMPKDLSLTSNARSMTFSYTFFNTSKDNLLIGLALPETIENFKISETNGEEIVNNHTIVVKAGEVETYNICITIDNIARDAKFSGTFNFTLTNIM